MFKRNLSLVIAAMLGAVLIACGSTDTAKTTKKADTENTEAVTELSLIHIFVRDKICEIHIL